MWIRSRSTPHYTGSIDPLWHIPRDTSMERNELYSLEIDFMTLTGKNSLVTTAWSTFMAKCCGQVWHDGKQVVVLQMLGRPTVISPICLRGNGALLPGRSNIRVSGLTFDVDLRRSVITKSMWIDTTLLPRYEPTLCNVNTNWRQFGENWWGCHQLRMLTLFSVIWSLFQLLIIIDYSMGKKHIQSMQWPNLNGSC